METDCALGPGESDASIIERSVEDPHAFSVLFERHFEEIHRYLARRIGVDRADDLAADVFAVAFARRATFRAPADVRPWLFGIATNLLRNEWRAERRALNAIADLTAAAEASVVDVDGMRRTEVLGALAALDAVQRDVVLLFAWEGLSYQEIGSALGVPVGTVRSRLSRARRRLRKELGDPACQWPSVSPHPRPSVLPTGGHVFSPLVATNLPTVRVCGGSVQGCDPLAGGGLGESVAV